MPPLLTADRRRQFDSKGFFVVEQLLSQEEVGAICTEITRVVEQHPDTPDELIQWEPCVRDGLVVPPEKELGVRKLFRVVKHNEFFRRLAAHPRLLEITKGLLGPDLRLLQSMTLMKPPRYSTEKIWHQDNAYFRMAPSDVLGFWIALDPATVANGCMHVVPASHRHGIVPHQGTGDEYGIVATPDESEVVPIPLRPGDGLIFHGELFHFTPANSTQDRRRAVQYHYAAHHCRRQTGDQPFDLPIEVESLNDV